MFSRRQSLYMLGLLGAGLGLGGLSVFTDSAQAKPQILEESRVMMGTFVSIKAQHASQTLLEEGLYKAFERMAHGEEMFTRHDSASPLTVLASQGFLKDAPQELCGLCKRALQLSRQSQGAFNPTIAPVLRGLVDYKVATVGELPRGVQTDLATLCDSNGVVMEGRSLRLAHAGMAMTLDGIAKGYIADMAACELEAMGIYDYIINAGGDIRVGTHHAGPWKIGVQNAQKPTQNSLVARIHSGAIATSGNYDSLPARGYDHLVQRDALIGEALQAPLAVTVLAPTCVEADALATALFAMGQERGMSFINSYGAGYACLWQTERACVPSSHWNTTA